MIITELIKFGVFLGLVVAVIKLGQWVKDTLHKRRHKNERYYENRKW